MNWKLKSLIRKTERNIKSLYDLDLDLKNLKYRIRDYGVSDPLATIVEHLSTYVNKDKHVLYKELRIAFYHGPEEVLMSESEKSERDKNILISKIDSLKKQLAYSEEILKNEY